MIAQETNWSAEMAALWHPSLNGGLTPSDLTPGSRKQVWWQCGRGHAWRAMVYSVKAGTACPYCAGRQAIPGETDLATTHPDIAAQWSVERNGGLTPQQVLPSAHDKVWWRCSLGHEWQAMVFSRTRPNGSGCPYCTGKKVLPGFNDLATLKPDLAREWHAPLNGDLRPSDVTPGSNKKVWWQCAEGHVWQAAVYSRTRRKGTGCPVCAGSVKRQGTPK